jgi:hypothetical protein
MEEMIKIINSLLASMAIFILPLISYSATATEPSHTDTKSIWLGGPVGDNPGKLEGKTLAEISIIANPEAALSGRPVTYRTEDGKVVY